MHDDIDPAAVETVGADVWASLIAESEARDEAFHGVPSDDPHEGAALDYWLEARDAAINAPAPDISAVAWKLRQFHDHDLPMDRQHFAAIIADVERLAAAEIVATPFATAWLAEWAALRGTIHTDRASDRVMVGERLFFRDPDWAEFATDERYEPRLRIYGREELQGARKALKRLLVAEPDIASALAELALQPPSITLSSIDGGHS